MDHELICFTPAEMMPERERHMIHSPKLMVMVAWNTIEYHVFATLPKATKCNTGSSTSEILEQIKK
jgi:hypothetical protein